MAISTAYGNASLDWLLGGSTPTRPGARYLALHTADPGLTGENELTGTGYARQATTFGAASTKSASNTSTHTFTNSGGSAWTQVTHFGLWDASTAGGFIWGGALTTARTLGAGEQGTWASGALVMNLN